MKIAISANGNTLEAGVDPRFGRCPYFVIIDPQTMQFEAIENTCATGGGAGIATAQMISGKGVGTVLTGSCGPNACQALTAAGIEFITGVSGSVTDAVNDYNSGKLKAASEPNVDAHSGMKKG